MEGLSSIELPILSSLAVPEKTYYSPVGLNKRKDNKTSDDSDRKKGEDNIFKLTLKDFAEVGKKLSERDTISLIFLILDDPGQAFNLCKQIEAKQIPTNMNAGAYLMAAIFNVV